MTNPQREEKPGIPVPFKRRFLYSFNVGKKVSMKNRKLRIVIPVVTIAILLVGVLAYYGSTAGAVRVRANTSATTSMTAIQKRLLDGLVSSELNVPRNAATTKSSGLSYFPDKADDQCALSLGSNTKVNQNCLNLSDPDLQGRAQAQNETSIAQDPLNSNNIVATYNDYRRGDGTCGISYTLDGGKHWNDATTPNGFVRGGAFGGVAREYFQAGGDPSVAWDSRGNAYYNCMVFMRGQPTTNNPDGSSGIYMFRSTQNNGASWNFTGRPVAQQFTEDPSGLPLLDKPYMTIDNNVRSPFRDRIYTTYTLFGLDGSAIIYEAFSSDFGEHFSAPVLVSASSPLCPNSFGVPTTTTTCNENQFSDPFTGRDGNLYVVYQNFNNSLSSTTDNHNQILLSKSTDGGASFSPPVLVANWNDLPDCFTYQGGQDAGRACVPEKGTAQRSVFRATNYPSGAVNPTNASQVVVTFGSYINANSNPSNGCVPAGIQPVFGTNLYTGVKTPGACNNKILESVSTNGGASFNGTVTDPTTLPIVSSAPGQTFTDQWWQWAAFTTRGQLAVSYYDRQYGNSEFNGFMDISLSGSTKKGFAVVRVTSASMPPPTQFPDSLGNSLFFGDYSGLTAGSTTAFPLWMDTRSKDLFYCTPNGVPAVCTGVTASGLRANDQDIFTQQVKLP